MSFKEFMKSLNLKRLNDVEEIYKKVALENGGHYKNGILGPKTKTINGVRNRDFGHNLNSIAKFKIMEYDQKRDDLISDFLATYNGSLSECVSILLGPKKEDPFRKDWVRSLCSRKEFIVPCTQLGEYPASWFN